MKRQSPHLHPLFKFPFLHRSLMSWRAAVVVAVLLFSPLLFPFFKSKRKTKKSKEKQSKEKQKAEQKEDNVLVLFLLPFHLFFIPFPLSPFSFPFFFPSFSIRHVCTHSSPRSVHFDVRIDAHVLLQRKEKSQRKVAPEACSYPLFRHFFIPFSFPMSAHESKRKCERVEGAMSAHLLFFFLPFLGLRPPFRVRISMHRGLRPRLVCG